MNAVRWATTAAVLIVATACAGDGDETRSIVADNLTTQSAPPATPPISTVPARVADTLSPVDDALTAPPDRGTETTPVSTADTATDATDTTTTTPSMPEPEEQQYLRLMYQFGTPGGPGTIEGRLGYAPILLEPGTYETDAMQTPVRFVADRPIRLVSERTTFMVLVDDTAAGLWDTPILHWIRPDRLVDPTVGSSPPNGPLPTIDGWDFDAWFAAVPALDVERSDVSIGGMNAVRYDVGFPDADRPGFQCDERFTCLPLLTRFGQGAFDLVGRDAASVWVIPQGEHRPIVIMAAVRADDGHERIDDAFGMLLDSVELGEPAPVGIPAERWEAGVAADVPAGEVELPILDGVRFDLPLDTFVNQRGDWSMIVLDNEEFDLYPPNVEIAAAPEDIDGTPIDTPEQLVDLLVAIGGTPLPDGEVAGRRAMRVELFGVQPGIPVFRHADLPEGAPPDAVAWSTQDYVELWAFATDAGVMILTAEAEDPEGLDVARKVLADVSSSMLLLDGASAEG